MLRVKCPGRLRMRGFLALWTVAAWACAAVPAQAGGGPENLLLIIDPTDPESKYVGNYYKNAHGVPDRNVVYMDPGAVDYQSFAADNVDALFGTLANRRIADHIDYILVAPSDSFYVPVAPGLIADGGCAGGWVRRIAISAAYTLAHFPADILGGGLTVFDVNHQASIDDTARAFDHDVWWTFGRPGIPPVGGRYFIGFMLGYTGPRGNTVDELIAMIDRSVAVDGTRPAGAFYFMKTADGRRSNPRDPHFPSAIAAISALGGQAEQIDATLPVGRHDCLGILTGAASPAIDSTDMTLLPGSFCDHLTSFAGTFDTSSQVKMSRWIAKGASGSMGTVEEPCVIGSGWTWKFPQPRFHVWYAQGMTLGESLLRSIVRVPFQCLFYGDPLTRPFAHVPIVDVPDAPFCCSVSKTIELTPVASTTNPAAGIDHHDLYVDGVLVDTVLQGGGFPLETDTFADGCHDLRVVSYDDSPVATQGRWTGDLVVDNHSTVVTLAVNPTTGSRMDPFTASVSVEGGSVAEVRLLHNNRVVAAGKHAAETFDLLGEVFGAGPVRLTAEVEFADGRRAFSRPVMLDVAFEVMVAAKGPNQPPVAYSYTKDVPVDAPILVELPASDPEDANLTYTLVSPPARGVVEGSGPVILFRPVSPFEPGTDSFSFRVADGQYNSNTATVTIRYAYPPEGDAPVNVPATSRRTRFALMVAFLITGVAVLLRAGRPARARPGVYAGFAGGSTSPRTPVYRGFRQPR